MSPARWGPASRSMAFSVSKEYCSGTSSTPRLPAASPPGPPASAGWSPSCRSRPGPAQIAARLSPLLSSLCPLYHIPLPQKSPTSPGSLGPGFAGPASLSEGGGGAPPRPWTPRPPPPGRGEGRGPAAAEGAPPPLPHPSPRSTLPQLLVQLHHLKAHLVVFRLLHHLPLPLGQQVQHRVVLLGPGQAQGREHHTPPVPPAPVPQGSPAGSGTPPQGG